MLEMMHNRVKHDDDAKGPGLVDSICICRRLSKHKPTDCIQFISAALDNASERVVYI